LIKKYFLKKCNLVSIETHNLHSYLSDKWGKDIKYIPNGFYDNGIRQHIEYENKKNIILTVGRIGSYQKATEVLLEGFIKADKQIGNWELRIVGPIEPEFAQQIDVFFDQNIRLKNKVSFVGEINDRTKLNREYQQAKIFCLPSRWESFGIVSVEAAQNGCYLVSTKLSSLVDISNNNQYGSCFEKNDSDELAEILIKICNDEQRLRKNCIEVQEYIYKDFYWPKICKKIYNALNN